MLKSAKAIRPPCRTGCSLCIPYLLVPRARLQSDGSAYTLSIQDLSCVICDEHGKRRKVAPRTPYNGLQQSASRDDICKALKAGVHKPVVSVMCMPSVNTASSDSTGRQITLWSRGYRDFGGCDKGHAKVTCGRPRLDALLPPRYRNANPETDRCVVCGPLAW